MEHKNRRPPRRQTAQRALRAPGQGRRALTNVEGAVERSGDPWLSSALETALTVRSGQDDATLTHPFHAYPARMHPEIARRLLSLAKEKFLSDERSTVLDPFCGSGTVLVECSAAAVSSIGRDLSPLAIALSWVKTRATNAAERDALVKSASILSRRARELARSGEPLPVPEGEHAWFAPAVLSEVAALAALIPTEKEERRRKMLWLLLSSVLVKVSRQRSDSAVVREEKQVSPGFTCSLFARKAEELARCLAGLRAAQGRVPCEPELAVDDATVLSTVGDERVQVVVTSPPYANTYDYAFHHARRYAWLALDDRSMKDKEIGAARSFSTQGAQEANTRFTQEVRAVCASLRRVLRPGGVVFLLVGDGAAGGKPLRAESLWESAAMAERLVPLARASQERPLFDQDHQRAYRESAKREHLIALQKL